MFKTKKQNFVPAILHTNRWGTFGTHFWSVRLSVCACVLYSLATYHSKSGKTFNRSIKIESNVRFLFVRFLESKNNFRVEINHFWEQVVRPFSNNVPTVYKSIICFLFHIFCLHSISRHFIMPIAPVQIELPTDPKRWMGKTFTGRHGAHETLCAGQT